MNPLDIKIMAGAPPGHARVTPPMVLGLDLAGVVTEIGTGVTRFDVGSEVFGLTGGVGNRQGSLAEYVGTTIWLSSISLLKRSSPVTGSRV